MLLKLKFLERGCIYPWLKSWVFSLALNCIWDTEVELWWGVPNRWIRDMW